eukprot:CAMPEP_0176496820 /NCGR_PEP_ID=MMETSP0200_2-20121128/11393_1 /TAXON_ID=947934 /ORGANISM="Chaetoceros sp., Strain GSL56" /LENGTH=931 /DNA_ID=CAMNT_0017894789 /DNA_START=80 /DNA_END=2875 /DNA_ORIENTATION=+
MKHGTSTQSHTTTIIHVDHHHHPIEEDHVHPAAAGHIFYHDTSYGSNDDCDSIDDNSSDEMNENEASCNIACATVSCKVLTRTNETDGIPNYGYCSNGPQGEEEQETNNQKQISNYCNIENNNETKNDAISSSSSSSSSSLSSQNRKSAMVQDTVNQEFVLTQSKGIINCNHGGNRDHNNDADANDKRKRKVDEISTDDLHHPQSFEIINNKDGPSNDTIMVESRTDEQENVSHGAVANNESEKRSTTSSAPLYSDLEPLYDAPTLPPFPSTGCCEWTFDEDSRVLLGKFKIGKAHPKVTCEDESFLLRMMERTDIAVISEGLFVANDDDKDCGLWNLDFIAERAGDQMFHRFRRFESTLWTQEHFDLARIGEKIPSELSSSSSSTTSKCPISSNVDCFYHTTEIDGDVSMRIRDYIRYIKMRVDVQKDYHQTTSNCLFSYKDGSGKDQELDVKRHSVYMIDLDVKKFLPETAESFLENFLMPGLLPGGKYCMMNAVNVDGRPFMGPNLYLTPPGSFTHFHQDGHGTVDSGHLCLRGYNEVVMLRRMSERHMENALHFLKCNDRRMTPGLLYDALYGLPHHNGEKPLWPDNTAIENCKKFNYYPCVFVLKPGQLLHINKGRLHAFRKMSTQQLEANDCHSSLRKKCIVENNITADCICMSIAWDWMYRGVTETGINDEVYHSLDSASLARNHGKQSLAIPQLSLIQTATFFFAKFKTLAYLQKSIQYETLEAILTVLKGVYPGLKRIVSDQIEMIDAKIEEENPEKPYRRVIVKNEPDSDNGFSTVDPFGNDFFCFLCHQELGNAYMHCNGCEELLQKDFNICLACHSNEDRLLTDVQMHPYSELTSSSGRRTDYNHAPRKNRDMQRCGCKKGPNCKRCKLMTCCSCKCHQDYSLRFRLYSMADLKNLLDGVANAVGQRIDDNSEMEEVEC